MPKSQHHKCENETIIFTCTSCGKNCNQRTANIGCSCGCNLFKVSGMSTTFKPLMDDPDSQFDPYRKKQYSPEKGIQFTNNFGLGTPGQNAAGTDSDPHDPEFQDEEGGLVEPLNPDNPAARQRTMPSDGGVGDTFPSDANADGLLPDDSPLKKKPARVNPFNNMQSLKNDDPYEIIRKRRVRR